MKVVVGHELPFQWVLSHELALDDNFRFDPEVTLKLAINLALALTLTLAITLIFRRPVSLKAQPLRLFKSSTRS